jgi:hypothetical protein
MAFPAMAQVCAHFVCTAFTGDGNPFTNTGSELYLFVPMPSSPLTFAPQHQTPSSANAQVRAASNPPAEIALMSGGKPLTKERHKCF